MDEGLVNTASLMKKIARTASAHQWGLFMEIVNEAVPDPVIREQGLAALRTFLDTLTSDEAHKAFDAG